MDDACIDEYCHIPSHRVGWGNGGTCEGLVSSSLQQRPLAGVKVVELARILAGPYCGQLLADLGADVVKVERSRGGDDTRTWGPPFVENAKGEPLGAAYYHACNRGKRGVVADFETQEGQALVRRLVQHADVVIENFKVGGLKKYELAYENLISLNPRLIWCSISGFGQDGPYAARAGYDFLIQGMGGLMSLTGPIEGPPMKTGVAVTDLFTALYATNAIQAALYRRIQTGEGVYIDSALLDTQVSVLSHQALHYLVSGHPPHRLGNGHPSIVPYDVFPTQDGNIIIACGNDGQFQKLMAILGEADLATHPSYRMNQDRVQNREELTKCLRFLTHPFRKTELLARLEEQGIPAGPIQSMTDVFADPQVIAREMQITCHTQGGDKIPGLRPPFLWDGQKVVDDRAAPRLGEHQEDVFNDPAWGGGPHA